MECSFCGESEEHVNWLIAGPVGAAICDACVYRCVRMLESASEDANQAAARIVREATEGK